MRDSARKEKVILEVLNRTEEKEKFHQDVELLYILDGSMNLIVSGKKTRLMPGDIYLINSNKSHSYRASEDILFVKLSILYEMIGDIIKDNNVVFWCDSTREDSQRYEELRKNIRMLMKIFYDNKSFYNFRYISLCYRILDIITTDFVLKKTQQGGAEQSDENERIDEINDYIRANYNKPVSIKELSEKLYLSVGYLSRFFKKNYGMNFTEYITQIRLFYAVDDLLYTEDPITVVAYNNGFSSVTAFNKAFKAEYHETPSMLRKRTDEKKHPTEREQVEDKRLEKILWDIEEDEQSSEGDSEIRETISWKKPEECEVCRPTWCKAINIGTAADLLKSEVREHVILLKHALKFEYIRFWNPFSREMLIDIRSESDSYNFSRVDSVLDFILDQGLKPHIEIGEKPKRIQSNTSEGLVMRMDDEDDRPEQWEQLMERFMDHIRQHYGAEEIASWRLELWDKYSDYADKRADESDASIAIYFQWFQSIYQIVKKYSPSMEVGGKGWAYNLNQTEYLRRTLRCMKDKGIKMDFISFILYPYISERVESAYFFRQSADRHIGINTVNKMKAILEEYGLQDVKLYITEWNTTISDRNRLNDTCYKAACTLQNYIDIYGTVDEMDYFYGTDRVTEYFDSSEILYGGSGLLTRDGIMKPCAFAFYFLNRLKSYYISKGEHYLATLDQNGDFAIVCHNCSGLSYYYYTIEEDKLDKKTLYKYYEDGKPLTLHFTLDHMVNGNYQVKKYVINKEHGSIMDLWEQMEFEQNLSRDELKYFRRVCEPHLIMKKMEVTDKKAEMDVLLQPNEICLIRVKRKM